MRGGTGMDVTMKARGVQGSERFFMRRQQQAQQQRQHQQRQAAAPASTTTTTNYYNIGYARAHTDT